MTTANIRGRELLRHIRYTEDTSGLVVLSNLRAFDTYVIEFDLVVASDDPSAATYYPCLRLNGDSTANYDVLKVGMTAALILSTTVEAAQPQFVLCSAMGPKEWTHLEIIVTNAGSETGITSTSYTNGSGAGDIHYHFGKWGNGDQVTEISIHPVIFAGGIGKGSELRLFGL